MLGSCFITNVYEILFTRNNDQHILDLDLDSWNMDPMSRRNGPKPLVFGNHICL